MNAAPAAGAVLWVCKAVHSTVPVAGAGIYQYRGLNRITSRLLKRPIAGYLIFS